MANKSEGSCNGVPVAAGNIVKASITVLALVFMMVLPQTGPAAAAAVGGKVLVFGSADNGFEGDNTAESLRTLGLAVDRSPTLPSDLTPYGSVWYVEAYQAMTPDEQTELAAYIAVGGNVYLTGERPCCESLNAAVQAVLDSVLTDTDVGVGGLGDIAGPYTFNPNAADDVTRAPNVLLDFVPDSPGGMSGISGVSSRHVFATTGTTTVGAVWDEADMRSGLGRVALLMDIDWLGSDARLPIIQNIQNFLSHGATCSSGGTASISWSPVTPRNCTTLVAPTDVSYEASGPSTPTITVAASGVTADCTAQAAPPGMAKTTCHLSAADNTGASVVVTASAAGDVSSRYNGIRPKNDNRNVPVPFALDSNWWNWPDADGDGLPDLWEEQGVWVDGHLLDLPSMGARSDHKDLFLHVDFEQGAELDDQVFDDMKDAFDNSPSTNPDGNSGVTLHVERGTSIPSSVVGDFDLNSASVQRVTTYSGFTTSPEFGGPGVPHIFKYLLNLQHASGNIIGRAQVKGEFGWTAFPVDKWVAALEIHTTPGAASNFAQASNATHELGHLLGLRHHGAEDEPDHDKTYKSVMSYTYSNLGVTGGFLNATHTIDYSRTNTVNNDWKTGSGFGSLTFVNGQYGEDPDFYSLSNNESIVIPADPMTEPTFEQQLSSTAREDFTSFATQFSLDASPDFPTLSDETASALNGQAVTIPLHANDPESRPLTYLVDQNPDHGTVAISGNSLVYTPAAGYSGADSAIVRATNGTLSSDAATMHLTVSAATPPPASTPPSPAPAVTLRASSLPTRTGVSVPVSWRAPGTGLRFDVSYRSMALTSKGHRVYGDWHAWLSATSATRATFGAASKPVSPRGGRTYELRVRSRTIAGVIGVYSKPVAVSFAFDDRNSALRFAGHWKHGRKNGALAGTMSSARRVGATVTLTGVGSRVNVIAGHCSSCGRIAVIVDGKRVGSFDEHAKHADSRRLLFTHGLRAGKHTVKLVLVGPSTSVKMLLDGIALESRPLDMVSWIMRGWGAL